MSRNNCHLRRAVVLLIVLGPYGVPATAAVHDLAAEFDATYSSNPDGNWSYGYVSSNSSQFSNNDFLRNSIHAGFVPYDTVVTNTGGAGGMGWTTGLAFPFTGVWSVPQNELEVSDTFDLPSAEGENPAWPNGIIAGHGATTSFLTGWRAVKYTADATGPVDLEVNYWAVARYPEVPPNPPFGGNNRPHQILIEKEAGSRTHLLRAPTVTRHGWVNVTGMPEHTLANAPTPGDPASYATQEEETAAAIASSANPNIYRLTNINLNAGESLIIIEAGFFGDNNTGFHGLNAVVRTATDRIATAHWDLADDWSVHGPTAAGIGPDAAWSYGLLQNGSFAPYEKPLLGRDENPGTVERESHGWGTSANGWFVAEAAEPATGPVIPGMVKDYSGFNFTKTQSGGVVASIEGDWNAGKVALHTPPSVVDADRTSVIRWTAPRAMNVDAVGALWRLTLPDATDRRHDYQLLKNGNVLASGTINELGFAAAAVNSANPEAFSLSNIAVVQGDRLELLIFPRSGGTGSVTADFDNNGTVDGADLAKWKTDFNAGAGSDADGDGDSDGHDFLSWQRELGMSGGGGGDATESFIGVDFTVNQSGLALAGVPEPTACVMLLFGVSAIARRRPKRVNR